MIDTIRLSCADFTIKADTKLIIEQANLDYSTGEIISDHDLFWNENKTEIVKGKKAYLNSEYFNASIKPKFELNKSDNSKLLIQASLPKIFYNGNNLESLDADKTYTAIFKLQELLANNGIVANLFDSSISRYDTFINLRTKYNFRYYSPIFKLLNGLKKDKYEYNGTTFLFKNTQGQICIYDKVVEMNHRKLDTRAFTKQNILRIENRFITKRKVFNTTGFKTARDLIDNYDDVKKVYVDDIKKNIFKVHETDLKALNETEIKKQIEYFREHKPQSWFASLLKAHGYKELIKYDVKYVTKILDELTGGDRRIRSRIKKLLSDAKEEYEILIDKKMFDNSKLADRYNELKDLFYKSVA